MPKRLMTIIKIISTTLIIGVLGLELGNLYALRSQMTPLDLPFPLLWIGRFALVAHFLEGIIAFIYAPSRNQPAIASGIYTFFVGTVGLVELFELQETKQE
ncbi:MAG: hypothetical protein ACKO4S_13020 [Snowella sp.]|jgi:hypothetical protein|nr:MAG: hypothetical protein DCF12_08885 [Snowella sp.]